MCLHTSVNLSRGRAVTNVGRTCGPTPLLVLLVILSCNKICLYYTIIAILYLCQIPLAADTMLWQVEISNRSRIGQSQNNVFSVRALWQTNCQMNL